MSRYSRIERLEGIGPEGMARLRKGRVAIVGCGALGSMAAMQLAASGVGRIAIADFDTIEVSNLQRQLFFDETVVGQYKCAILAHRMRSINHEVEVIELPIAIDTNNAPTLLSAVDFVIDGSDNFVTKYMTAEVCESLSLPYCIGAVREFAGQVMTWAPGHLTYRDLFGASQTSYIKEAIPVLGAAPAIVASIQAAEAIKYLTGAGQLLLDRLMTFDLAAPSASIIGI